MHGWQFMLSLWKRCLISATKDHATTISISITCFLRVNSPLQPADNTVRTSSDGPMGAISHIRPQYRPHGLLVPHPDSKQLVVVYETLILGARSDIAHEHESRSANVAVKCPLIELRRRGFRMEVHGNQVVQTPVFHKPAGRSDDIPDGLQQLSLRCDKALDSQGAVDRVPGQVEGCGDGLRDMYGGSETEEPIASTDDPGKPALDVE